MRHIVTVALLATALAPPVLGHTAPASTRREHRVLTVHATDFTFAAPASISAGTTTFRLVNDGQSLHQISIVQLTQEKTLANYAAAIKAHQPTPWAVGAGGPSAAKPGQTVEATVTLDAGNYVLVCWAPAPTGHSPHMTPLTVTAPGAASAGAEAASVREPESKPDVRLELFDYAFRFSKPLTAGRHTIYVRNSGTLEHEAVFVKLAPGKTIQDVAAWLEGGMRGPLPADLAPGMSGLGPGRTGTFTTDLTPGRYGVVCAISDVKDGRLHTAHGMMQEFTVAAH